MFEFLIGLSVGCVVGVIITLILIPTFVRGHQPYGDDPRVNLPPPPGCKPHPPPHPPPPAPPKRPTGERIF
jgi:hypothetical protein